MANKREISQNEINSDAFIKRLKESDEQSFSDLFSFIVPKLCGFVSSKFKLNDCDSEEVAADVMVKVNKSVKTFNPRGGAKLSTWIFRIAQNAAIDFIRQKQAEKIRLDVDFDDSISTRLDEKTAIRWFRNNTSGSSQKNKQSEQLILINRALDNLSQQDKSLLLMRQSMEYEEIAEVERVNVVALRTRYSRAFERLRRELEGKDNL